MWKQNDKIVFNILRIYIIVYHTYLLLYYKEHIHMKSNESTINVETKNKKQYNKQNDKISFNTHRIYIIIIILTCCYIVKDTFRW